MIITYNGLNNFTVKTKNKNVKIGSEILLGELKITSRGEYESGGVQVELVDNVIEIYSEKITVASIQKAKVLTDAELERLSGIDVLLIGVGGGAFTETKTALEVINQIDPKVVIPMYEKDLESFTKEEGVKAEPQDQYKFTLNDLPTEERLVVILNSGKNHATIAN